MLDVRQKILEDLKRAIKNLTGKDIVLELSHPMDERHGDYSTNAAMTLFKVSKDTKVSKVSKGEPEWKTPMDLAREIADKFKVQSSKFKVISKIEIAPPGFINFWLSKEYLTTLMIRIIRVGDEYGSSDRLGNKKIMVEFAHPNTHKEMHIGHMRTLITGEALARIFEANKAKVFRANYQGDIGPHVAKAMYGVEKILEEKGLTIDTVEKWTSKEKAHFLGEAYVRGSQEYEEHKDEVDEINAVLYSSSEGAASDAATESRSSRLRSNSMLDLYKKTRQWSLDYYDEFYKRFYTRFDKLFFESDMVERGKDIVLKNIVKIFVKDNEAIIFPGERYGLHTRVFITQAGYPTYEGKEMANAFEEYEAFPFDRKIHVVASEQSDYFKVVFKALELIDLKKFKDRQYHIPMGMVHLSDRKMSSRTGDVLTVDWLIEKVKDKVNELIESGRIKKEKPYVAEAKPDLAEEVAVGAIKYSVLRVSTNQDVAFDIEKSVSLEGDSGPYLQYSFARTQSVARRAKRRVGEEAQEHEGAMRDARIAKEVKNYDFQQEEINLLRSLAKFEEIVEEAAENFAPNIICNYLFDLAQKFNLFYQKLPILESEQREFRLALTAAVGQVIKNGLYLLGIKAPTKM